MKTPVHVLLAVFLLLGAAPPIVADEEAPAALTWHHEGFASLSKAAGEAKAQGKRLLLGLSGAST